jgi:hypothetical protein
VTPWLQSVQNERKRHAHLRMAPVCAGSFSA